MYFDQLYLGSTREVLGIDQSIAINMLSMPAIEVGAQGRISKVVKDRLRSLFQFWVPLRHRSGFAQMIKCASWISLVRSFFIFQACNR
jgi:hypothetical protein